MGFTAGLVAIAIAILMIFLARPRDGIERAFVRNWMSLVGYTMTIMVLFIAGLAAVITNWL